MTGLRVRLLALLLLAVVVGSVLGAAGHADGGRTVTLLPPGGGAAADGRCPLPGGFRGWFEAAADDTGLPLGLLVAMAQIESSLRPDVESHAGARGLLQLMPATAAELGVDADDPADNVLGGARYLRALLDRFDAIEPALAAYNAGPTAVAAAGGAPTAETASYVTNVIAAWRPLALCT